MTRYIYLLLAILAAAPRYGLSQCTDSSTLAANNYYLIKGAEARENLALCREYRKIDSAVIETQGRIQDKLLNEIKMRDDKYIRLRRVTYVIAAAFILTLIL